MRQLSMSPFTLLFLFGLTYSQVLAEQANEAIIGGNYADKVQFKYHVYLQCEKLYCGGAIIAEQYILTAAHCVTCGGSDVVYQPYDVVAGIDDLHDVKHAITDRIETVYIHKQYNHTTGHNDIAILKLKHGLNLSHHRHVVEKIYLPRGIENLVDKDAVITGFGVQNMRVERNNEGRWVEHGGTNDLRLKYALVKILAQVQCSLAYPHDHIPGSVVCGRVHQRHKDHYEGTCNGDSGGPLVLGHEVIGILSMSPFACNETITPAKYTRVGVYVNNINNVISDRPDNEFIPFHVPH